MMTESVEAVKKPRTVSKSLRLLANEPTERGHVPRLGLFDQPDIVAADTLIRGRDQRLFRHLGRSRDTGSSTLFGKFSRPKTHNALRRTAGQPRLSLV